MPCQDDRPPLFANRDYEFEYEFNDEASAWDQQELEQAIEESGDLASEFEGLEDSEMEAEAEEVMQEVGSGASDLGERFYELSTRGFESEGDADDKINRLLEIAERDYFWKGLKKKLRPFAKGLLKKGLKLAAGLPAFQGLRAVTQLARGDLKGLLGSAAKAALGTAIPGSTALLPALGAMGFEAGNDDAQNRAAWQNFAKLCEASYDELARGLTESADHPLEASRIATEALRKGMARVDSTSRLRSHRGSGKRYRILLQPGETAIIKRA